MRERIARALFDRCAWHWVDQEAEMANFLEDADAVLAALAEPTDAMLAGACDKHLPGRPMHDTTPPWPKGSPKRDDECPHIIARRRHWQTMLRAAK